MPTQVLRLQGPQAWPATGLAGALFSLGVQVTPSLWHSGRPGQGKQVLVRPHVPQLPHQRLSALSLVSENGGRGPGGSQRPQGREGMLGEKTRDWGKQAGRIRSVSTL